MENGGAKKKGGRGGQAGWRNRALMGRTRMARRGWNGGRALRGGAGRE